MTTLQRTAQHAQEAPVKRVALVLRVSTDRQAANDEGSLKTQLQRLRKHIEYKTAACGEEWVEAGVYELRGVSGKVSMRSKEYQRLFADIQAGRVNTVLCTALERLCRSVKDFLWFFEFLNEHGAEFVCLKQNYDTTSAQGRLFVTIMMALAEFEREQTSERTRDATIARAERGLWNGGRLLGYDADPVKKGSLIPNPQEAVIVQYAFDKYLECGSIVETADAMNRRGYRSKRYTSRRNVYRPGVEFQKTVVQYVLKNPAYVGKKELHKRTKGKQGSQYQIVDAVWPAIVEQEKFTQAQRLMAENGQSNRNGAKPIEHVYCLGKGLLGCGRCGTGMEGESATGRTGKKYFYYRCKSRACGLRVAAEEVEGVVLDRLRLLADDAELLSRLTAETNRRLQQGKPRLERQRAGLEKDLREVKTMADRLLTEWAAMEIHAGRGFLRDKLNDLGQRQADLERGLAEVTNALADLDREAVSTDAVRAALAQAHALFGQLRPHEQRELMQVLLQRVEVNERQIVLEVYAMTDLPDAVRKGSTGEVVRAGPDWLPEQDSNLRHGG